MGIGSDETSLRPFPGAVDGQTLIFDADDTLWENNRLFERVIDDFIDWLEHPTLDRAEIRRLLNDVEAANTVAHGYGTEVFLSSLADCFERLQDRPAGPGERHEIEALARALVHHEVELMPGVADTLADLGRRHELLLLTKGAPDEQQRKIDASGLAGHFRSIHIVREKDVARYRVLAEQERLALERTWMIGNSPKSDILPAREAGMGAVFIPSEHTWALEEAALDPHDDRVIRLERFTELRDLF
jgi:putative hydrolase of the HAD superfamily